MSIIDKLKLINERHADFQKKLVEKADFTLERYAALNTKTDRIFDRHHLHLDEQDKGMEEIDGELDRLSNLGNEHSGGSSPGSRPPALPPKTTVV